MSDNGAPDGGFVGRRGCWSFNGGSGSCRKCAETGGNRQKLRVKRKQVLENVRQV